MDKLTITPNIRGGNQKSMVFTILNSNGWERETLNDPSGTTYECTRVRGNLILSYNPGAASFKGSVNGAVPLPQAGRMPVQTDVAIRRFLEQPRFQIEVESAGKVWLQSPEDGPNGPALADVRNGPFMKVNSIVKIAGERLWQIHVQIETYINEHPQVTGTSFPPLILSNRWRVIEDVDFNHLRTRTYQGLVTVRSDVLQAQTLVAGGISQPYIDYFRDQFAPFNCPKGHQRTAVKVEVTPDGNSAFYTVTDTEQMYDRGLKCPAVRIEINDTNYMGVSPGAKLVGQFIRFSARIAERVGLSPGPEFTELSNEKLAKCYKSILVRVWGNKITRRVDLIQYAISVAYTRMGTVTSIFDATLSEIRIGADTNNYVEVQYTLSWGRDVTGIFDAIVAEATVFGAVSGLSVNPSFSASVGQSDVTNVQGFNSTIARLPAQNNVPFPNGSGTRGTFASYSQSTGALSYLITQALEQFDASPASVTTFTA